MLIKFPAKTKYFFNLELPLALLFQWTLPTIEKQTYIHTNFGDLIYDKCKNSKHSHPPLSQRETSNDPEKFVNSDLDNSILIKDIELPRTWQRDLKLYCDDHGIEFMSTPFDNESLIWLDELNLFNLLSSITLTL